MCFVLSLTHTTYLSSLPKSGMSKHSPLSPKPPYCDALSKRKHCSSASVYGEGHIESPRNLVLNIHTLCISVYKKTEKEKNYGKIRPTVNIYPRRDSKQYICTFSAHYPPNGGHLASSFYPSSLLGALSVRERSKVKSVRIYWLRVCCDII